ncbi:MAG TPA: hypothetical protein P5304_26140 [Phycisphaerae bacterium]|nr:hypothetical protein [Phycisphaerae bacterium]
MTIVAGLALVITFFLPISGLEWSYTPAQFWLRNHRDILALPSTWSLDPELLGMIWMAGMPHFWGLMMAGYDLSVVLGVRMPAKLAHFAGAGAGIACAIISTCWLACLVVPFISGQIQSSGWASVVEGDTPLMLVFLLLGAWGSVYGLLVLRQGKTIYLYHGFAGALALSCLLGICLFYLEVEGTEWTGLTLSFAACSILLVARIGDARAMTKSAWPRTILGLLLLRPLRLCRPGLCPQCRYDLRGLPEARCPECGRPFTPEEAGAAIARSQRCGTPTTGYADRIKLIP